MTKRVGVFSDLHGDKQNLEVILKLFKQEGVNAVLGLGDYLYDTQTSLTEADSQAATQFRTMLSQESPLRQEVLDGHYSNETLERMAGKFQRGKEISKKIAKAEYIDINKQLAKFDHAVLGGNWDHRDEIAEVFQDNYLNATTKNVADLMIAGFSGGGSQPIKAFSGETLADNQETEEYEFRKWSELLLSKDQLEADIYISHVPFSDGRNVKKESAVEHLKESVLRRKKIGVPTPNVFMWGHRHGDGNVNYNEELEGFTINPGTSSRFHNETYFGSFMIANFDENNKLESVDKYHLHNSINGLANVELVGNYVIKDNKVEFKEINKTIISEFNPQEFKDNLSIDSNYSLKSKGVSFNYSNLNVDEKDQLLRNNLSIVTDYATEASNDLKSIVNDVKAKLLQGKKGKIKRIDIDKAINEVYENYGQKAAEKLGINMLDVNPDEKEFFYDIAINAAYSLAPGLIHYCLNVEDAEVDNISAKWNLEKEMCNHVQKSVTNNLGEKVMNGLEANDYQEIVEDIYLPLNFKKKRDLTLEEARQLWDVTNQTKYLPVSVIKESGFYEEIEDFSGNKKTEEELKEMFQLDDINEISLDKIDSNMFRKLVDNGEDIFKDEKGDYLLRQDGGKEYLGQDITAGVDYTPKTMGELIDEGSAKLFQIGNNDFLATSQGPIKIDREEHGLLNYQPTSFEEFQKEIRDYSITQKQDKLGGPLNQRDTIPSNSPELDPNKLKLS